jgi:hypothetical protein
MDESLIGKYPIEQIEVSHLRHYLSDRNWVVEPFGRKEVLKFRSPKPVRENKYFEILIPSDKDLVDYLSIVINALKGISSYEKRSIDEIIPQMLVFGDLLKFHIATKSTKMGNIPFGEGLPLYDGIRDLLIFSACAEQFPGKRFFSKRLKAATIFADSSLIAPSNYGSYVANILCPVPRRDSQGVAIDEYPPIERRSVIRILRGLKDVTNAVENDNPNHIVDNYQKGLNANMCEALISVIEVAKGNDLNFRASLAPLWAVPEDIVTEISLKPSSKEYLEAASNVFDEQIPKGKCTLFGMALNLKRNPQEEENIIRLATTIEGRGDATVAIPLDEASYRRAVDSHKEERFIRVTGTLEKINGRWYLTSPEGLEIIGDIDPKKIQINQKLKSKMERTLKRRVKPNLEKKIDSF